MSDVRFPLELPRKITEKETEMFLFLLSRGKLLTRDILRGPREVSFLRGYDPCHVILSSCFGFMF